MKASYILPLLITFILLIVSGCREEETAFRHQLDEAEVLMRTDAQSAFRQLCDLNEEAEKQEKALRMRHLLLRCNAQNKADSLFSSDSLGLLLTRYYDGQDMPNQRVLAHYVLGCAYRDMGEDLSALSCFNEAVMAADTSAADCDFYQLGIIYGQMAGIYTRQCLASEALAAYNMAEKYAKHDDDSLGIYNIWSNKSNVYFYLGQYQEGVALKEQAADGLQKMGYPQYAAQTRGLCIEWLSKEHQWDKAKSYLEDYVHHSGYFHADGTAVPGHEDCYDILLILYIARGEADSARHYLQKWAPHVKTLNDSLSFFRRLHDYYYWQGRIDSAYKYSKESLASFGSLHTVRTTDEYQRLQAQNNYRRHERNALKHELESQHAQFRLLVWTNVSIAGLLLILAGGLFGRRAFQRLKTTHIQDLMKQEARQQQALSTYEAEKQHLKRQIVEHSHTIELLHDEIQQKTNDLIQFATQLKETRQKETDIMELRQKLTLQQDALSELQQEIAEYRLQKEQLNATRQLDQLYEEAPIKRLIELAKQHETPDEGEWKWAIKTVEKYHPKMKAIRFMNNISDVEYHICILIKLRMSIYDIMQLTGKKNGYLSTARKRLLDKIFKDKSGAKDFDRAIQEF